MSQPSCSEPVAARVPDLLTVEEAARCLRIGRTKAYAMTREWRSSGGRFGLPVVDLGDVLRVPRRALEQMLGVELTTIPGDQPNVDLHVVETATSKAVTANKPARRSRVERLEQVALFEVPPSSRKA